MTAFIPHIPLINSSSSHQLKLSTTNFLPSTPFYKPSTTKCLSPFIIKNSLIPDQQKEKTGRDLAFDADGRSISYDYFSGSSPTIVFLPGFYFSRWRQAKANALEIFAKRKNQAILVEEYLGIGSSEGDFVTDGTLSRWIDDSIRLIDQVVTGKVILVGAGVGGWIMLHIAMKRPQRVVGMVGINPSLDFTEDLLRPSLTDEQKREIETEGVVNLPWGYRNYPISKALLEDAKQWLVLRGGPGSLDINCPIRLLQGLSDEEVPPQRILELVDAVKSNDVIISFVKGGDHFLEEEEDFQRMWHAVCDVSDSYYEYDLTSPGSG